MRRSLRGSRSLSGCRPDFGEAPSGPMALAPNPAAALLLPLARNPGRRTRGDGDILAGVPGPRIASDPAVTPMPGLPDRRGRTRRRRRNEFRHRRGWRHRCGRYDRSRRLLHDDLRGSGWRRGFAPRETHHCGHEERQAANDAHGFTPSGCVGREAAARLD
jgi:hypothetical protein